MTMAATSGVDVVRVDDGGCHAWLAAGGFGRRRQCGCSRRSWLLGSGRVLLTLHCDGAAAWRELTAHLCRESTHILSYTKHVFQKYSQNSLYLEAISAHRLLL